MKNFLLIAVAFLVVSTTQSQQDSTQNEMDDALKVYFDCNFCDMDYFRNNVKYVNYVRDRKLAQVHILTTSQRTGSGGREYTFNFIGQLEFAGQDDSISVIARADATSDERREMQVKFLQLGLMRYVAQTPMIDYITLDYTNDSDSTENEDVVDNWDYWVFRLSAQGYFNGQEAYKSLDAGASISANRITEKWKFENWGNYNYSESTYQLDSVTSVFNFNENFWWESSAVRAINNHWSIGGDLGARSSTYSNIAFRYSAFPAIEYNIFDYADFTTKQIRLKYSAGYANVQYVDTTIFNQIQENLLQHRLRLSAEFVQKWGSVNFSTSASQYLHDTSLRNLSIWGSMSWRIVKGLSINFGGSIDFIQDQIALPAGGASEVDILTRQRQLATQYSYYGRCGISYTFGSIYNNIVNPRFGN